MTSETASGRVTEIISLLRPERPRRLPESLAAAAADDDIERMQLWLDRGASLEQKSMGNATPLTVACSHGRIDAVRWLIARGASLEPPDVLVSPIQSALGKGNCEVAAVLLDAGLPIDRAAWGVVAAAMLGRLDVLQWLLSRGVDLDREYPRLGVLRERALRDAKKEGREEVVRFLNGEMVPGPPPATPPTAPAVGNAQPRAASADRPQLLEEALDLVREAGKTAAHWNVAGSAAPRQRQAVISFAAGTGITELVTALLDAGAPPNAVPDGTPPPLTSAAGEAQLEVVRLLLQRGALPDGLDGKSWLPLASAAQSGDAEVVRALLSAGANPRAKPAGGAKLVEYARGPFAAEIRSLIEDAAPAKRTPKTKRT